MLRDVGPGLEQLPWGSPRGALGALSTSQRGRLAGFRQGLHDAWLSPRPELALVRELERLDPSSLVGVHSGPAAEGPSWLVHSRGMGKLEDDPIENQRLIAATCLYDPSRRDAFSDRPVALGPLLRRTPVNVDPLALVDGVLHPNQLFQQLRMVIYQRGSVRLFVGQYRGAGGQRFAELDHAVLLAARPALAEWVRVARAIGIAPLGDGALVATLAAIEQPALLLRRRRVVFANAAGARLSRRVNEWSQLTPREPGFAAVVPLSPGGVEIDLVLPRQQPALSLRSELTPALVPVAHAMAEGLSDKEIAVRLGLSVRTARTYAQRVLARLGLSDRRQLMTLRRDGLG